MTYAYDPLGRPKTTTSGSGSGAVTTTDTYNIQGWLTARTAQKSGGTNVFSMSLGYYSPVQSGAAARYSGDISSWTWTQSGQGQKAYAYTYDGAHRLTAGQYYSGGSATNALSEKAIAYDRAGNITSLTRYNSSGAATTLSYSYTGNRRSTFGYDINGNVTNDATNSLQTSYNLLNLPVQTKSGSTVKANHTYLSDGTKASVLNTSGTGYDYNGSFTYSHASGGTRTLESVAFGGGRIRKNGSTYAVDYYVTDHLGSVRAIVNASGAIVEQNDYYPFGTRQQNGLTTLSANRWRFSSKEGYDNAFGIALDDFGARLYDRTAWTSIDPLAEKYYSLSPYAYCAGNPVRFVDPEGKEGVRYIDENGRKTIESNIVVLQRPLETIPSDLSERAARRIQRRNARLQEENAIEISNIQKSLDDIYNGDKGGSYNSDGELVYFKFNVVGVYTDDIDGNNTAFNNSVRIRNGITVERFNTMAFAAPAIIAKGSTEGHFGIHKAGSVICVRQDAPYATLAHEVGHSFHLKDKYDNGGLMNIFPTYLLPEEVDTIWNEAYPK